MVLSILMLALYLISVGSIAGALVTSRSAHRELERRANLVSLTPEAQVRAERTVRSTRSRADADRVVRGLFCLGMRQRWTLRTSGFSLFAIGLVAMAATWALFHLVLGFASMIAAAIGGIAFLLAPQVRLRMEQEKMDRKFIELFPGAIDMIVRMLRAGLPITATVRTVSQEASPPVGLAFAELADQMDIGITFEDALRTTAKRIGLSDLRFFAAAASLQRTTGGNLAETLEILSDIIRKKRAGRLKAIAVTAEVRMTALVLGSLPIFIVGALMITRPDYLVPLVTDPRGNIIAGIAIGMLLTAFVVIRQMMRSVTRPQ